MNINWSYPPPRKGFKGAIDRLVGPGATKAEAWIQLGPAILAAIVLPLYAIFAGLKWNPVQLFVASLLALDMVGGAIGNAASSVKRYLHRKEFGFREHFIFVLIHAIQLFIATWIFRGMDWTFFIVYYLYLVGSAFIILKSPLYLRRPVAVMFFIGAVLMNCYLITPVPGFEWFIPIFFFKLLVSHCLREEPYRPEEN